MPIIHLDSKLTNATEENSYFALQTAVQQPLATGVLSCGKGQSNSRKGNVEIDHTARSQKETKDRQRVVVKSSQKTLIIPHRTIQLNQYKAH